MEPRELLKKELRKRGTGFAIKLICRCMDVSAATVIDKISFTGIDGFIDSQDAPTIDWMIRSLNDSKRYINPIVIEVTTKWPAYDEENNKYINANIKSESESTLEL